MKKAPCNILINLTAKHAYKFNQCAVHVDKKKETKKNGFKTKHKEKDYE